MDLMTAIATASKSLELVKAIKDIDKQLGEAELKARAAELLSSLTDHVGGTFLGFRTSGHHSELLLSGRTC